MENEISCRLVVIGGGPGGYTAAIKAAQILAKRGETGAVVLIERREAGGTCLNRGCIPTKSLLHAADLYREMQESAKFGIQAKELSFDFEAVHNRKTEAVLQLRAGVEGLLKANKITVLHETAVILEAGKVQAGEVTLKTQDILIATGSVPAVPPIPGADLSGVFTSDDLLENKGRWFDRLIIIGGGVIGMEFASIYNALGCQVTVLEAAPRILPNLDRELSQSLTMQLKKRGVAIYTGAMVEEITSVGAGGCHCRFSCKEQQQTVESDSILLAVGRRAAVEGLCAPAVNLCLERGYIVVNDRFETSVPGIRAIGDVSAGTVQLAHVAAAQGVNAVCHMFGEPPQYDMSVIPSCIYTSPEIACAGISADEAKALGIPVRTGKALMSANGKTVVSMGERGFVKLVFHEETKKLLGAQLLCERASDMIGGLADAMVNQLTMEQMAAVIRPHPTFCEAVGEAVEDAAGMAIHAAPKRR